MALLERLEQRIGRRPEAHAIDKMAIWGAGGDPIEPTHSGADVSQHSALRVSVVWRCKVLLSETLAALPADVVRKRGEVREPVDRPPAWLEVPNPETSWFEFIERVMESLVMDGNAFVLITARDFTGHPSELWTLNPRAVDVRKRNGRVEFVANGDTNHPLSRFGPTDPAGDVLHIKLATGGGLRGMSPIEAARQSIGTALTTEKAAARFFGRGSQMQGVIEMQPANSPAVTREYVDLMRDTWRANHAGSDKAYENPGILIGASWSNVTMSMADAQFLQTRSFQVEDIATRFYGVPPNFVGLTEKQTSWGTGLEEQSLAFLRYTLLPHIVRLETGLSLLTPRGQFVRLNQRGLIRADSETESRILAQQLEHGVITFNRWRELQDQPPRPGGDRYMIPSNMTLLEPNGEKAPPPPQLVATPDDEDDDAEPPPSPNGNGRVTSVGGATK